MFSTWRRDKNRAEMMLPMFQFNQIVHKKKETNLETPR